MRYPDNFDFYEKFSNSMMRYKSKQVSLNKIKELLSNYEIIETEENIKKDLLNKKILVETKKWLFLQKNVNKYTLLYPILLAKISEIK